MKYETIKTTILVFLVAVSVYLTWTLWTFQVKYNKTLNNGENVPSERITEQRELKDIMKPLKIIFHEKGNHIGTTNPGEIEVVMNEISSWKFYDIGGVKEYKKSQLKNMIQGTRKLEMDFPDLVPFETFKGIIQLNDKKYPVVKFDRIIIDLVNPTEKVTSVYFINTKVNEVFSGLVSSNGLQQLVNRINNKKKVSEVYQPYSSYKLSNGKTIFLPDGEPKVNKYKDYWDKSDEAIINEFKPALFRDPKIVQMSQDGDKIEYNDGTRFMKANLNQGTINFVNQGEGSETVVRGKELIKASNDFVNQHGGWIDNFLYFDGNLEKNQVIFRLFKKGLPVFNTGHLADVQLDWGEKEIYEYQRPYLRDFETLLTLESSEVKLESAESVINQLMKDPNIESNKIDNILIGYQLEYIPKKKFLLYEPKWYYQYDGRWLPLMSEEDRNGLEQNEIDVHHSIFDS